MDLLCSFLSQRRQAVKLDGLLSKWAPVHAEVPQGTKLGPLFLVMVNDLACKSSYWKYFEDITISEVVPLGSPSTIQNDLDSITAWAEENCMNLNPKKCKEMRLSFLAKDLDVLQLTVNDTYLEKVSVHKVLGITLRDSLKWGQNTKEIVEKACKRLYLLRVLKRAGVPPITLSPYIAPLL